MHISEVKRMQDEKDLMMRHGMTHPVNHPSVNGFAKHDGDYDNNHLAVQRKDARSNDRMPRSEDAYDSNAHGVDVI